MRKNYSIEQKSEIIRRYLSGHTITELSLEYGMSHSTLYKWIEQSPNCQKQERQINMRDYYELNRRCKQQEKMIEILQNAPCTVSSPLQERYDYILSCLNAKINDVSAYGG